MELFQGEFSAPVRKISRWIFSYCILRGATSYCKFLFLFGKINHGAKKKVCQVLCVFSPLVHLDSACAVHPLELDGMAQDDLEQMSCWRGPNWNQSIIFPASVHLIYFACLFGFIYLFFCLRYLVVYCPLWKSLTFFSLIIFLWMFLARHGDFVFPFWA